MSNTNTHPMFSLKKDFQMNKPLIRKQVDAHIYNRDGMGENSCMTQQEKEEVMDVLTVLNYEGDTYTAEECELLLGWWITPNDEHILYGDGEDFSNIEIWRVNKKQRKLDKALEAIAPFL